MTYSEKLQSPKWQKKRLEILQRDEFTCQGCSDKDSTLHVHHIHYNFELEPWEYDNDSLITMCVACHKDVTYIKKEIKQFIDLNFIQSDYLFELLNVLKSMKNLNPPSLLDIKNHIIDNHG